MCGSGTFLIEAALIATNTYPGIFRQHFAFEKWPDFEPELLEELYNDDSNEREYEHKIYGSDISVKATAIAERNIKSAGVGRYIELTTQPIQNYETAPGQGGIIVTNPPYGERIAAEDMEALYEAIGNRLKHVFKGYTAWILGYRQEHFDKIGLKPSAKIPTLNGALECEFRKYEIFEGTYAAHKRATATEPPKPRPVRSKDKPRKDDKKPYSRGDRKPMGDKERKPFERKERKPLGDKERKPYGRRDEQKSTPRGEKGRFEKRERPTSFEKRERPTPPSTTHNAEGCMPKKTTAGSRTRTRKNNNENK
jgi:putative N6-adenine-specific DNA methylase